MNDSLKIECEWWGALHDEKDLSQVCRGAIGITVGEDCLTRLEDTWGNTVRNRMNASAYTLASWIAGNWWRLRWEPETPNSQADVDWRLSHSMGSAGDGYCWPNILFTSDGETLEVTSHATRGRAMGPVRYLNEVSTRITANAFESGVDAFLTLVISRLLGEGYRQSELEELWAEVQSERNDPNLAQWRRLEAICGYDPGEAPEALISLLIEDSAGLGLSALEELAATGRHETAKLMEGILDIDTATMKPAAGGFQGSLPSLAVVPGCHAGERPWQRATRLAQLARKEWGLEDKPITNAKLADLLGNSATVFDGVEKSAFSIPIFLRQAKNHDNIDIYLNRAHPTSRRFAASRLLGDSLFPSSQGRLYSATTAKTVRQQFQRAFAQEFLCPYDALREKIQTTTPDEDDIAEAASYFNVSTRVVEATLVNKGEMDRQTLSWVG